MIAVVTEFKEKQNIRKIKVERIGEIALVRVGRRVGKFRLKRALSPYGNDIIFAPNVNSRGIPSMDTEPYKRELLFKMFLDYCLNQINLDVRIGIVDNEGQYLDRLIPVISRVQATVIYSERDLKHFCKNCLIDTGTCPEIASSYAELCDCDVVFSPEGLVHFPGILFGNGGITISESNILLPNYCEKALNCGADKVDLAAALSVSVI